MPVNAAALAASIRALRPAVAPTDRQVAEVQKKINAIYDVHLSTLTVGDGVYVDRFGRLSPEEQNELATACEIARWQRPA